MSQYVRKTNHSHPQKSTRQLPKQITSDLSLDDIQRAVLSTQPESLTPKTINSLQKIYGNHMVQRLISKAEVNHSTATPKRTKSSLIQRDDLSSSEKKVLHNIKEKALKRKESDREKAVERFIQLGLIQKGEKDTLVDAAADLLKKAKLTINFKLEKLDYFINSDRVKTSWEVGSDGERNPNPGGYGFKREVAETQLFGYDSHNEQTQTDLKEGKRFSGEKERIERPKYAASNITNAPFGAASKYGTYHFVLKDSVKDRSTFTGADTFRNIDDEGKAKEEGKELKELSELVGTVDNMYAVLATGRPEVVKKIAEMASKGNFMERGESYPSLVEEHSETVYSEAQIHGNLGWNDIEEIAVPASEIIELHMKKNALKKTEKSLPTKHSLKNVVWTTNNDNKGMNFFLGNPTLKNEIISALEKFGVNDFVHEFRGIKPPNPVEVPLINIIDVKLRKDTLKYLIKIASSKKVAIRIVGINSTFGTWNIVEEKAKKFAKKYNFPLRI